MKFLRSLPALSITTGFLCSIAATSADVIAFEDFDGGAVNLLSSANVFEYDASADTGGGTAGRVFGRVLQWLDGAGTGGPYAVMDDSAADTSGGGVYPSDSQALVGQNSTGVFAMNDSDAVLDSPNNAVWTFDISSATSIGEISIDIAAMGTFEASTSDGFTVEAQIDGGGYQTIFEGIPADGVQMTYRPMDGGSATTYSSPLEIYIDGVATGIYLDKSDPDTGKFDTYSSLGFAGQNGSTMDIRISWNGNLDGYEPMGFDNITVNDGTFTPEEPAITLDPESQTLVVGSTATFTGNASGFPAPTYQWYKGEEALTDSDTISGTTSKALKISNLAHSDAGDYYFVASNSVNTAMSMVATLTVEGFGVQMPNTNTFTGIPISVPVGLTDNASPITSVTATSGNQSLLPDGSISPSGSGSNWSLNLAPSAGVDGVAIVTVSISDGSFTTNTTFGLIVVPSSGVFFNDFFDYADGALITEGSNVWVHHSGSTMGEVQVVTGNVFLSHDFGEDVNATLIGAPYTTNSGTVLFSKFTLTGLNLPSGASGDYLAHFKNAEFNYLARLFVSTNNASGGSYRVSIGNGSGTDALTAQLPTDLSTGVPYTVVTRLDLQTGISTIWVDPTQESDSSVTDPNPGSPSEITGYALRQSGGIGDFLVDDLVVGGSFDAVMTGASIPIPLTIEASDENIVLKWSDPSFSLQAAPNVSGTYTNVPGATSPYTNAVSGDQTFFRLIGP